MKVTCRIDGTLLASQAIGLRPVHTRFVETNPATVLTAEIDVGSGETVDFEVYDFVDPTTGQRYEVHVDRIEDTANPSTVLETWERNDTHCISGEYHQHQVINLKVTASESSSSGSSGSLTGLCSIHVQPVGRG